jgi:ribonuclease R
LQAHSANRETKTPSTPPESVKLKQVEYLSKKKQDVRTGTISGVTEWGIYIEDKESGGEGMVRLMNIQQDSFEYVPKKFAAVGARTKRVLRLGDTVRFMVVGSDLRERTLDFSLVLED